MMSRGPHTFKQCDVTRAIKAALAAGLTVERAWVETDGRIMLGFKTEGGTMPTPPKTEGENTWADVA